MAHLLVPFHGLLWWALLVVLGLIVGLVAGMFGVGAGFMLIPALTVAFRVPIEIAVGTGLCQTVGTAVAALRRHQKLKQGELRIDWMMLPGAMMGVKLGADTVDYLTRLGRVLVFGYHVDANRLGLAVCYSVLLTAVGASMIRDVIRGAELVTAPLGPLARIPWKPRVDLPRADRNISALVLVYLGLLIGYLSGLMGIGGGILLMPILMYGIGMGIRMAAGTGILLLAVTAMAGTLVHTLAGHVNLVMAMLMMAGSTIGAPIGATITSKMTTRKLRAIFGGLLIVTAIVILWDLALSAS